MSNDTGELIFKKSINLCCQPIFSYISSFVIAPNAPFSQSLSHIFPVLSGFHPGGGWEGGDRKGFDPPLRISVGDTPHYFLYKS